MRSRCVRQLERCVRLASCTSSVTPSYARAALLAAPTLRLTWRRQAERHSFLFESHTRGLSGSVPTPEPNDDKAQLKAEPKTEEKQGLKHTKHAKSDPTAEEKEELRAEKDEGAAKEEHSLVRKLRADDEKREWKADVKRRLEDESDGEESAEEDTSLYDAELSQLARSNKVQRATITPPDDGIHVHVLRLFTGLKPSFWRRLPFIPSLVWFHWTMGYEMSEPHIPLKATHEHLRHAFLMAQKLLRTGDEEAARQMLTPRLQEAFAHVHASYTANGLSFWYDDESAHLDEGDVHLNRAFPRDFMAGTLNMLRKEHHAAFLAVLDDEDAKVADGLQESGEVRADSQLWPFLEMVGVTPSMLKNDTVQSGCSVNGLSWLVIEARYDAVVTSQVYNRSGQLVLEHTDERPNFYQFVRGPLKGPTGFEWIPDAVMGFFRETRTHRLQSDCTPWRLACVGMMQKGQVKE